MTDTDDVCGSTDTSSGDPCQRPAGWGRDADTGPCETHHDEGEEPGGRPGLFTPDRRAQVIERAKLGATLEGCARAAGVSYRTLRNWLDKGRDSDDFDDEYVQFFQAFQRARATGEEQLLRATAQDDPKFILQSSYDYVKTERQEVEGDVDVDVSLSSEEKEQLDQMFDREVQE